ncbi:hypothetical protein MRX96_002175 [Rhipicephalus microplus]
MRGDSLCAQHTRSRHPNAKNAEGCGADQDSSCEQDSLARISNSATLPETKTTFAQVPVSLVHGLPFTEEELMTCVTMLIDTSELLQLPEEHSFNKCTPDHLMSSNKVFNNKDTNVTLWLITELPIDVSSIAKKCKLFSGAQRQVLAPWYSRSPPHTVCAC